MQGLHKTNISQLYRAICATRLLVEIVVQVLMKVDTSSHLEIHHQEKLTNSSTSKTVKKRYFKVQNGVDGKNYINLYNYDYLLMTSQLLKYQLVGLEHI